ncbi:hypothetical protein L6R53_05425 [Myxococcota bacterium]|nr:hypothetical protein [Myxococcota bacterium]
MLLVLAMLGCRRDCATFDDMTVADPEGLLVPSSRWGIEQALVDFATWTGRDGVCVPGIEVVDDREEWWGGLYRGPGRPILVGPDPDGTHQLTVHELCHALDEDEGIVEAHGRLFHEDLLDSDNYKRTDTRRAEVFARLCDDGPQPVALLQRLHDECGIEVEDLLQRQFLAEHVWLGVTPTDWATPGYDGAPGLARPLSDDGAAWNPVSATTEHQGSRWTLARYDTTPEWLGGGRPGGPEGLWLVEQELDQWRVRTRVPVDLAPFSIDVLDTQGLYLVPGDDGLYVMARAGDRPSWHLDPATGQLTRVPALAPLAWEQPVAVAAGRVLRRSWVDPELPTVTLHELADGSPVPLDLPLDPWGQAYHAFTPVLDGSSVWTWELEGLAELDLASATVRLRYPLPPDQSIGSAVRSADGRWGLEHWIYPTARGPVGTVLLLDPLTGQTQAPEHLCEQVFDPYTESLVATSDGLGILSYDTDGLGPDRDTIRVLVE